MKKLKYILFTLGLIGGLSFMTIAPAVSAADFYQCDTNPNLPICKDKDKDVANIIGTVVRILLFIVGSIAVIMIIISGIQYVTSAGNADAVKKAKSTLLYSIIGLIIALLAYGIVFYIIDAFK